MIDFKLKLENEKTLLRPVLISDIDDYFMLTSDKTMWVYFTSDLSDRKELENWVNDSLTENEKRIRVPFTIIDKTTNRIAGATSFGNISERDKRIEIGWTWLGKEFQGTGLNRQVKFLMLNYCFEVLKFERVEIKTDILNIAARKALKNMHITEEGILRSHTLMTHGRRRDTIYFSVLKNEWETLKNVINKQ